MDSEEILSSDSDIEALDIPSDIELDDFSSGSGEGPTRLQ